MEHAQPKNRKLELRLKEGFLSPNVRRELKGPISCITTMKPIVEVTFNRKPPVFGAIDNTRPRQIVGPSQKLETLKTMAMALRTFGEKVRIAELVDMVRKNLVYPYPGSGLEARFDALENDAKQDDDKRLSLGKGVRSENLSVFVDAGIGKCRHFAALYGILGASANLDVELLGGIVRNFNRPDTKLPAFKSIPLGVQVEHAFNEVHLNGERIPVDPTANMVCFDDSSKAVHYENYGVCQFKDDEVSIHASDRVLSMTQQFNLTRSGLIVRISVAGEPKAPLTASFDMEIQSAKPIVEGVEIQVS